MCALIKYLIGVPMFCVWRVVLRILSIYCDFIIKDIICIELEMCEVSRAELENMLCPQLSPQILYCLDNGHQIIPMFNNKPVTVLNVNSSHPGVDSEQRCDRVTLSLPLCQTCVSWELIFDHTQLDMPPDFTFGDDFIPDLGSLKQLEIYSLANPESLLLVLQELFDLYRYLDRSSIY